MPPTDGDGEHLAAELAAEHEGRLSRRLLGVFWIACGINHFVNARAYEAIVPPSLAEEKQLVVQVSGVAELAGGAGVLVPGTRRLAGWWLIATLLAIFPANVNMAVNAERFRVVPAPLLWVRLPLQGALIAWVWRAVLR